MNQAQRNGGPKTAAGKINSSRNAVKHGLTSTKMFVLQNENPEAWAALLAQCVEGYRPSTDLEHTYVETIAFALWRLKRVYAVQTALIDIEMDEQAESFATTYDGADETIRKTLAVRSLLDDSDSLIKLSRYETALQRAHDRAVKNLKTLREMNKVEPEQALQQQQPPEPDVPDEAGPTPVTPIFSKLRNELPQIGHTEKSRPQGVPNQAPDPDHRQWRP